MWTVLLTQSSCGFAASAKAGGESPGLFPTEFTCSQSNAVILESTWVNNFQLAAMRPGKTRSCRRSLWERIGCCGERTPTLGSRKVHHGSDPWTRSSFS